MSAAEAAAVFPSAEQFNIMNLILASLVQGNGALVDVASLSGSEVSLVLANNVEYRCADAVTSLEITGFARRHCRQVRDVGHRLYRRRDYHCDRARERGVGGGRAGVYRRVYILDHLDANGGEVPCCVGGIGGGSG